MARLSKSDLLTQFEEAIRQCGWNLLYLTKDTHPARYQAFRDGRGVIAKVYIWNISHGGVGRKADEYRIQVTGFSKFDQEPSGRTLILGWWDEVGVFAGWDHRHHQGVLGGSPSMQISEGALRQALLGGFAPYVNQKGETAIAFRPDFAGTYLDHWQALHDSGAIPAEAALLEKLSEDPDAVSDKDIDDEIEKERRFAVVATRKALRANDFARRVLSAYGHRCAICEMQLRLVDGAHILPVEHAGNDQTRNGIALCALHHRAYDKSLVTFDANFKVHINTAMLKDLTIDDRAGGLKDFQDRLRPILSIPPDKKDWPWPAYVAQANELRGWSF